MQFEDGAATYVNKARTRNPKIVRKEYLRSYLAETMQLRAWISNRLSRSRLDVRGRAVEGACWEGGGDPRWKVCVVKEYIYIYIYIMDGGEVVHTNESSVSVGGWQEKGAEARMLMPFAALWMRAPSAVEEVKRRLCSSFGVQRTIDGKLVCLCALEFAGTDAIEKCTTCVVRHGVDALHATVQEAVPSSSEGMLGGRWLEEGELCPACGSTRGGWMCGGSECHVASCEEALLYQGMWSKIHVRAEGELQVDCQQHCVHMDGQFLQDDRHGACAIVRHLAGHAAASKQYNQKMKAWAASAQVQRPPKIADNFLAREGPITLEFSSRVRAFTRIGHSLPAADFLQRLVCGNSAALATLEKSSVKYRRGSVVLPDNTTDGFVILRIDHQRNMVETCAVQQTGSCARHPRCVCFHIDAYDKKWQRMVDVKGTVACLAPRFGWRRDFTLPLSKVCWRRADPRVTDGEEPAAEFGGKLPETDQPSVSILRCAKLLELCRAEMQLQCSDYAILRCLGCTCVTLVLQGCAARSHLPFSRAKETFPGRRAVVQRWQRPVGKAAAVQMRPVRQTFGRGRVCHAQKNGAWKRKYVSHHSSKGEMPKVQGKKDHGHEQRGVHLLTFWCRCNLRGGRALETGRENKLDRLALLCFSQAMEPRSFEGAVHGFGRNQSCKHWRGEDAQGAAGVVSVLERRRARCQEFGKDCAPVLSANRIAAPWGGGPLGLRSLRGSLSRGRIFSSIAGSTAISSKKRRRARCRRQAQTWCRHPSSWVVWHSSLSGGFHAFGGKTSGGRDGSIHSVASHHGGRWSITTGLGAGQHRKNVANHGPRGDETAPLFAWSWPHQSEQRHKNSFRILCWCWPKTRGVEVARCVEQPFGRLSSRCVGSSHYVLQAFQCAATRPCRSQWCIGDRRRHAREVGKNVASLAAQWGCANFSEEWSRGSCCV